MKDQPSNADDDDRENEELEEGELEGEEQVEEELLTERQILERKAAEYRRLYPHLVSRYEWQLLGVFDIPPEMRKSLSWGNPKPRERDLFSDLEDDPPQAQQPESCDAQVDDDEDDDDEE